MLNHPPLVFQGHQLENVDHHKHLGLVFRSDLKWNGHINTIVTKATKQLNILKTVQHSLDRKTLEVIYFFSFDRWWNMVVLYGMA